MPCIAYYNTISLLSFCDNDLLDRGRLLSKLMEALANDDRKESFKGFMAFHELLAIDDTSIGKGL